MTDQNTIKIDAVPIKIVKQQFDSINAKGYIQLNEVRGPGVDLNTWSKYPCDYSEQATVDNYCYVHISIKTNTNNRKNWKLIPLNLTVLAIRKGEKTYIVNDKSFRDLIEEKIFENCKMEHIVLGRPCVGYLSRNYT